MTVNAEAYRDGVISWVNTQLAGEVTAQMVYEQGQWQGKARARLNFPTIAPVGNDALRWEQDEELDPGEDFIPTVVGNRQVTLSILMQTRDQRPTKSATYFLEKLRTSLKKPSVRAALYAAGLAHATTSGIVPLDRVVDDRWESQASMDVIFNAVAIETDTAEQNSYMDTVGVAATLDEEEAWPEDNFGNT